MFVWLYVWWNIKKSMNKNGSSLPTPILWSRNQIWFQDPLEIKICIPESKTATYKCVKDKENGAESSLINWH